MFGWERGRTTAPAPADYLSLTPGFASKVAPNESLSVTRSFAFAFLPEPSAFTTFFVSFFEVGFSFSVAA